MNDSYKRLIENIDHEIYQGRFHINKAGDIITSEGRARHMGDYDAHVRIGRCAKCLGATIEYDTGFRCLHCNNFYDCEDGPNRIIHSAFGEILVNSIGERL